MLTLLFHTVLWLFSGVLTCLMSIHFVDKEPIRKEDLWMLFLGYIMFIAYFVITLFIILTPLLNAIPKQINKLADSFINTINKTGSDEN